ATVSVPGTGTVMVGALSSTARRWSSGAKSSSAPPPAGDTSSFQVPLRVTTATPEKVCPVARSPVLCPSCTQPAERSGTAARRRQTGAVQGQLDGLPGLARGPDPERGGRAPDGAHRDRHPLSPPDLPAIHAHRNRSSGAGHRPDGVPEHGGAA